MGSKKGGKDPLCPSDRMAGRMGAGDIGVASGADLELQVKSGLVCNSAAVTKVV